jgi:hypothetical protein
MRYLFALLLLLANAAACSGRSEARRDAVSPGPAAPAHLGPMGPDPVGSTVVVAKLGARTVAIAADADERRLIVVDLASRDVLGKTPLDGTPSQILVAREGALFVALRDRARVAVLEPDETPGLLRERATIATDDEPFGLAETRDGTLLVTCAVSHALEGFDVGDLRRRFTVDLPREPRAVLASPTTGRAYVAHLVAPLVSAVDLAAPERAFPALDRTSPDAPSQKDPLLPAPVQGYALAAGPDGGIVVPHVSAITGRVEVRTRTSYGEEKSDLEAEIGMAAVVRESDTGDRHVEFGGSPSCFLPRAAVFPSQSTYLVACADREFVEEVHVAEQPRSRVRFHGWVKKMMWDDKPRPIFMRRRWQVGDGITGLAFDPAGKRVVAWAQGARVVGVFALDDSETAAPVTSIAVGATRFDGGAEDRALLGRRIFHRSGDPRIARDGRACASCHPDGLDDGLTWPTPDGPRQTPTLRGRIAETAPYGWLGRSGTLRAHLQVTVGRLGGSGLPEEEAGALVAYVESMHAPARAPAVASERGHAVFVERCASCHSPWSGFTDGERHDVGSRARADLARAFDTPSLRLVASTAPYFHDGRYRDLRALLDGSQGTMWHAPRGGLPRADRDALIEFLRTL